MMLSEFVERTGFEPMPEEYEEIEQAYYAFNGDKDAFCKAFVENGDGLAIYKHRAKIIEKLEGRILELDKMSRQEGEKYEARISGLEAQLKEQQEGAEQTTTEPIGNGCSYIIYISTSHDKVSVLHHPMLDLAALHPGWHWHVSTVQVMKDCRIPELYHGGRYWATLVEHNNGSWSKAPTYEIHCV